jgi:hypothetical protein
MYGVHSSDRKPTGDVRRALGQVWADIIHGQRRAAELNAPWVARRRSTDRH